jgi:hypothetical protein
MDPVAPETAPTAPLAKVLIVAVVAVAIVDAWFAVVAVRLLAGPRPSGDAFVELAAPYLAYAVTMLLAIVLTMWWYRRVYRTVQSRGSRPRVPRHWTWSAWVLPILALWRGRRLTIELWRSAEQGGALGGPTGLVNLWWTSWILAQVLGRIATRATDSSDVTLGGVVEFGAWVTLAAALVEIAAAVLFIQVIRGLQSRVDAQPATDVAQAPA